VPLQKSVGRIGRVNRVDRALNFDLVYPSQRDPVFARNVVATSQPLATLAGIDALKRGGNAIDAALAAAITLTVVEPCSNGLGSDAFALTWYDGSLYGLNGSGKSPRRWTLEHFAQHEDMPQTGWDSVTVPGAVSSWVKMSQRFGKLDFVELFRAAIDYAEHGFHIGRRTAWHWQRSAERFQHFKPFCDHFLLQGRAPATGELFKRPQLADTLREIAKTNGESFYQGALAQTIVKQAKREGGLLDLVDLHEQESCWIDPLSYQYGDFDVHEIPPNGQGLTALIALGILDRLNNRQNPPGSPSWTHQQVEAMRIATHIAAEHFADPRHMMIDPQRFLEDQFLSELAARFSTHVAMETLAIPKVGSDTVYLCTGDAEGNMVSFIQSNYMGFGSGVVIDGTGIALQNRGAGFSLDPKHPNVVSGSKRPFHTIIPGFVTKDGAPLLAFGVMGGHMQPQGHVQMITRVFDHGENPQSASDAPRWFVTLDYDTVLEQGYSVDTYDELVRLGHKVTTSKLIDLFGGAQLILRVEDGYCAASDHRKEGQAAGF